MYRVVIVDDDKWAIEDIKYSFSFPQKGFKISGEYLDSAEALEKILSAPPDLILSDIRMEPYSGLDLAQMCAEKGIASLFVMISGYDHFVYAQEAFRYSVFDYLLKPIDDRQVQKLMERVCTKLKSRPDLYGVPTKGDLIETAQQYIDEHYLESLSLESVAAAVHVNKNYLSDLFSKRMGMTLTDYRNKLRLDYAKRLLLSRQEESSINDVALDSGFESNSQFSKVFKRATGMSPQQYRNTKKNGQNIFDIGQNDDKVKTSGPSEEQQKKF